MERDKETTDGDRALAFRERIQAHNPFHEIIIMAFREERERCLRIVEETSAEFGAKGWSAETAGIEILTEDHRRRMSDPTRRTHRDPRIGAGVELMQWYHHDGYYVPLHPGSWSKQQIDFFETINPGVPWPYRKEPEQECADAKS